MKLFSLILIDTSKQPSVIVAGEYELSTFSYFQRSSVQEFMNFFSKTIAERTRTQGERQSVDNQDYRAHVYKRSDSLCAVAICDKEYPTRVAFALLSKLSDEFLEKFKSPSEWTPHAKVDIVSAYLEKYQDPGKADDLMKIQRELDETKIIMHKTIEGVLNRGEQLEDLVQKSDELSMASKAFHQAAKSNNSCCKLM